MTAKNFINFHVLISHSPSCLNRDDMNMQKTATFGGKSRVRISSQSLKRALRTSDYYETVFGSASIRSRSLEKLKDRFIEELGSEFDAALIARVMDLFVEARASETDEEDGSDVDRPEQGSQKKLAVAPWVRDEIRFICEVARNISLTDDELAKVRQAATKQKGKNKKSEQALEDDAIAKKISKALTDRLDGLARAIGSAVDIALSGRMATSGLMTSVDGALAVAHAITTHAVEPQDVDWFTAVDDLTQEAGETGAGHLNTQQFSAGVFYRYASLNLKQLQVNLGLIADIKSPETPESRGRALEVAKHVLHLLATVVPSAKQQSFAAHNLADLVLVCFSDLPVSLANAFEEAVKPDGKGLLAPSMTALIDYWRSVHAFHGLDEKVALAASRSLECPAGVSAQESLAALETWIARGGE